MKSNYSQDILYSISRFITPPELIQHIETIGPRKTITDKKLIHSVQFSPDGTQIVAASRDKTARVWLLNDPVKKHALWFFCNKLSPQCALRLQASFKKNYGIARIIITNPSDAVILASLTNQSTSQKKRNDEKPSCANLYTIACAL